MSNLGPLTTTYTPAGANCNSIFQANGGALIYGTVWSSQLSSCLPSSYIGNDPYYYSPGICPSGYTYACSASYGDGVSAGGVQATCCPTYVLVGYFSAAAVLGRVTEDANAIVV